MLSRAAPLFRQVGSRSAPTASFRGFATIQEVSFDGEVTGRGILQLPFFQYMLFLCFVTIRVDSACWFLNYLDFTCVSTLFLTFCDHSFDVFNLSLFLFAYDYTKCNTSYRSKIVIALPFFIFQKIKNLIVLGILLLSLLLYYRIHYYF